MILHKTWSWLDPVWLCSYSFIFPFCLSQKSDALKFDFMHKQFGIFKYANILHGLLCALCALKHHEHNFFCVKVSKSHDKQCKINLQIINVFKGSLLYFPQVLLKEILQAKEMFKSADGKWNSGVYGNLHYISS